MDVGGGLQRVLRDGPSNGLARLVRAAYREPYGAGIPDATIGFRLARTD
jgi:hypothetical protein